MTFDLAARGFVVVVIVAGVPAFSVGRVLHVAMRVGMRMHLGLAGLGTVMIASACAWHARGQRTPQGKQQCQQDHEPDAEGLHFLMLSRAVFTAATRVK